MKIASLAALTVALLAPLQAHAACTLTTLEVPVAMDGLRPLVDAKVAGQPVKLLLDSGAFFSSLDARTISELKLKPLNTGPSAGSHLASAAGTLASGAAGTEIVAGIYTAPTFEFAGGSFRNVEFLAADIRDRAGLLGQNVLHLVDDDYDLKGGTLRLIRPDDCERSDLAYWVKPGVAYSILPLEPTDHYDRHTEAFIEINGVKVRALFDTGAPTSFITARAAARTGVKTSDPGVTRVRDSRGLDRDGIKTWVAKFADIKIGDEEIKNTRLSIGESEATDFDVLIGADFFLAHHVYVANSQQKLYFSYSGGPVFRVPEAPGS